MSELRATYSREFAAEGGPELCGTQTFSWSGDIAIGEAKPCPQRTFVSRGPPSPGALASLAGFGGHPSRCSSPDAAKPSGAASVASVWRRMAERVGFEPTCRLRDKTLSRRPRYDHFGTSPQYGMGNCSFYPSSPRFAKNPNVADTGQAPHHPSRARSTPSAARIDSNAISSSRTVSGSSHSMASTASSAAARSGCSARAV